MATAAATVTSEAQWTERALELARANHLDGTATYLGKYTTSNGQPVCWHVPSRDRTSTYTVEYDPSTQRIRCHCIAASYGRPCAHAGAVVHSLRQRASAYRQARREYATCDVCSAVRPASEIATISTPDATAYVCADECGETPAERVADVAAQLVGGPVQARVREAF